MRRVLVCLTAMMLLGCSNQQITEGLLSVTELEASYKLQLDHNARTVRLYPVVRNNSGVDVHGPFKIAASIGFRGVQSFAVIPVPANVSIPKAHGEYTSDQFVQRELVYRDQDDSAIYRFDVLVDQDHETDDVNRANNYLMREWWTLSPGSTLPFQRNAGVLPSATGGGTGR